MKVEIFASTIEPEYTCAVAMRSTRTNEPIEKLMLSDVQVTKLLRKARKLKHFGVFEHATFTVSIEGISRVCTHQLVRHRLFSFMQSSSREIDLSDVGFIEPPSIKANEDIHQAFLTLLYRCQNFYETMVKKYKIPREDARFILPQATEQHIVVTGNARQWLHFFWMRCSEGSKAQWEIKDMAWTILEKLRSVAPIIFEELVEC